MIIFRAGCEDLFLGIDFCNSSGCKQLRAVCSLVLRGGSFVLLAAGIDGRRLQEQADYDDCKRSLHLSFDVDLDRWLEL